MKMIGKIFSFILDCFDDKDNPFMQGIKQAMANSSSDFAKERADYMVLVIKQEMKEQREELQKSSKENGSA